MRYEHSNGDWVEIEGAADMPFAVLGRAQTDVNELERVLKRILKGYGFTDWDGEPVDLLAPSGDPEREAGLPDINHLSRRQLVWLRSRLWEAVRDEEIDPEA